MIFRIHEDVVERKLDLIGRRTIPQACVQLVLFLVIVSFAAAFFGSVVPAMIAKLPPNWMMRLDCWGRLLAALAIMGVPALFIGGFALRLVLVVSDGCRRMTWDARTGELTAIFRGGLLGLRRRVSVPLGEIDRIDLHAAPGGQTLVLKMTVRSSKGLHRQPLEAELRVRHIDRREEAMDLLFRIARQCGLPNYAIETSDVRNLKLRVVRDSKGSDRYQPIPTGSSSVRYEDNVVSPGVEAPPLRVGKFGQDVFAQSVQSTLLKQWAPGERIHFHEPAADWAMHGAVAVVAIIAAGIFSYALAPLFHAWLPGWATMALAMVLAPLLACTVVFFVYREREIVLDWPTGTIAWRFGRRWRHAPLNQIERLTLRGLKKSVKRKKQPSFTKYWCWLEMVVQGRRVFIVRSNEFIDDPDTPANRLGSLAAALAEAVGVSWQWRDYDAWS